MPETPEPGIETITVPVAEVKERITGYTTVGRRSGKAVKAVIAREDTTGVRDVRVMQRGATRKVSLQERQNRETSDFEALRRRLRRTRSDDSLRSVDTAIWNPQAPNDEDEDADESEDETKVNDDMEDKSNYSGGNISTALAQTLESIRVRREARNAVQTVSLGTSTHADCRSSVVRQ